MGDGLWTRMIPLAGFGLTWLIQSSILLTLGLLAGRVVRRSGAALQSALYRTTLAAVLVSPFASALLAIAGVHGLTVPIPKPTVAERDSQWSALPSTAASVSSTSSAPTVPEGPMAIASGPQLETATTSGEPAGPDAESAEVSPPPWSRRSLRGFLPGFAVAGLAVWGMVSLVLASRFVVALRRMAVVRAQALPADAETLELCASLARRMRVQAPQVLRTPFLFSPCLAGLRRPTILLPEDVEQNLTETLAHELAHLSRYDGHWNLLRQVATAIFWIQPLLWVLSRRLEAATEEVCDDIVVHLGADRTRYASLLLELAGRALPPIEPAVVGMVSLRSMLARRVVRILEPGRALSTRAGARALVAVLAGGFGVTLLAGLLVAGPDGRPASDRSGPFEGSFDATKSESADDLSGPRVVDVIAATPPNGLRAGVTGQTTGQPHGDMPITGRVVNLEGRPVAGAKVELGGVQRPKTGDLSRWIDAVKGGAPPWIAYKELAGDEAVPEGVPRTSTTDRDGRFRIEGLKPERVAQLTLEGEDVAYTSLSVVTRKTDPFPARGFSNTNGPGTETVYGADFTITAVPSRPVEGRVTDAKTGRPLAGVEVRSYRFAGSDFAGIMSLRAKTDADGRFRLTGLPKGKGNGLLLVPADDQPYLMQELGVPDSPGAEPARVEAALPRGVIIEGTITEKATGKPVSGARLHYLPFLENAFAQAHPAFDKDGNSAAVGFQHRYQSKDDGTFRTVGLPGRAILGAIVYGKRYLQGAGSESIVGKDKTGMFPTYRNPINPGSGWPTVMKEINPPPDSASIHVDLQVISGGTVRLKVIDPEGKPVAGASVEEGRPVDASGLYEVGGLRPDETRSVVIRHGDRKLGLVVRVRVSDGADKPVEVKLAPLATITGRTVDAKGDPIAGSTIRVDVEPAGFFVHQFANVLANANGRFTVTDVPAGCDYGLVAETGQTLSQRRVVFGTAKVKPGESSDVGDLVFKND